MLTPQQVRRRLEHAYRVSQGKTRQGIGKIRRRLDRAYRASRGKVKQSINKIRRSYR